MFTVSLTDVDIGLKCDTKGILVFLDHGNMLVDLLKHELKYKITGEIKY